MTRALPRSRYQESGTLDRSFTGQKQDIATGQYDFLLREYSPTQGRWSVPDPAGLSAADARNPQSWNRYAYVGGTPLDKVDQNGEWPTDIHNEILGLALPGLLGSWQMQTLQDGSAYVDRLSNQGEAGANQHAMCSPSQSMGDCDAGISGFIDKQMGEASADGFNQDGIFHLGEAIHTLTDMESPFHSSPDGTPRCWGCNTITDAWHVSAETLVAGILGNQAYGKAIAQSASNAQAAFQQAFPTQYPAAVAGRLGVVATTAYTGIMMSTGAFPSTWLQNEVEGCMLGNPAACPSSGDFLFAKYMGPVK